MKSDFRTGEGIALCLILAVYAIAVIGVLDHFPTHPDEPSYTDAAASSYLGKGFTSGAWYAQGADEFWAGNVPLHEVALSFWYRLFGFTLESTRLVNLFYVCISMVFFWIGLVQSKWFPSSRWRIGLVIACLSTFSIGLMPVWGRPDGITLMLLCGAFCVWTTTAPDSIRLPCLGTMALLAPWAGLQLAVVTACFGFFLLVFDFKHQWKVVLALAAGTILGSALLVFLYAYENALAGFIASILPHASASRSPGLNPWSNRLGALKDPSFLFATLAMGSCTIVTLLDWFREKNIASIRLSSLLLAFGLGTPAVLVGLSKMPAYYSFFSVIPTFTVIVYAVANGRIFPRWTGLALVLIIAMACVFGAPWSFAVTWNHRADQQQEKMQAFVAGIVKPDDIVLYERPAYYASKRGSKSCYLIDWYYPRMTSAEKDKLTLLLMDRETFEATVPTLGGKWREVSGPAQVPNRNTKALSDSNWYRKNPTIELRAYRKATAQ